MAIKIFDLRSFKIKMKTTLLFFIALNFLKSEKSFAAIDSLSTLDISFTGTEIIWDGDREAGIDINILFHIVATGNKYTVVSTSSSFCGNTNVGEWKQELNDSMIDELKKLIKRFEALPNKLKVWGYVEQEYSIKYAGNTWGLSIDVMHDTMGFQELHEKIFAKQYNELKICREKFRVELTNSLQKKWYFNPKEQEYVVMNDVLTFKNTPDSVRTCYWEFGDSLVFNSSCRKDVQKGTRAYLLSDRYKVFLYFFIHNIVCGEILNDNSSFEIMSVTDDELKLKLFY